MCNFSKSRVQLYQVAPVTCTLIGQVTIATFKLFNIIKHRIALIGEWWLVAVCEL
jgi:hypothetical protein